MSSQVNDVEDVDESVNDDHDSVTETENEEYIDIDF